tara:strand:+ start:1257 stop:1406 length:150 start_codon:yes stop_codon:yes gene_type:complete
MMDFRSWQSILTTLAGFMLITVIGVGIRLAITQSRQPKPPPCANRPRKS